MIAKALLPKGTQLTPLNPLPRTWPTPADCVAPVETRSTPTRRSCFSRDGRGLRGFSEYTDAQVGRLIDYLEQSGSSTTPSCSIARQRRVG
jgi:arylsulfatase